MAQWDEATQSWRFAAGELEQQATEALAAEQGTQEAKPVGLRFDALARRFELSYGSGATFAFPADACEELANQPLERLAEGRLLGGRLLEWPSLDVHLDVAQLTARFLAQASVA